MGRKKSPDILPSTQINNCTAKEAGAVTRLPTGAARGKKGA